MLLLCLTVISLSFLFMLFMHVAGKRLSKCLRHTVFYHYKSRSIYYVRSSIAASVTEVLQRFIRELDSSDVNYFCHFKIT